MKLKDRLARIKNTAPPVSPGLTSDSRRSDSRLSDSRLSDNRPADPFHGWTIVSDYCLKRVTEIPPASVRIPPFLSGDLAILVPALRPLSTQAENASLLFFDLETTGLSGGAGTVAFLAAFGQIHGESLAITQFLLLDYPGEYDLLEASLSLIEKPGAVLVTFNGKTFDSQILKNRCLVNGLHPPDFGELPHADLLYTARRLWKKKLSSCAQAEIEKNILGITRTNDLGGAFAPEAWFSFLRTHDAAALLQICEHNLRDIAGLASLLGAMNEIAGEPFDAGVRYQVDLDALSRIYRIYEKKYYGTRWPPSDSGFPKESVAFALTEKAAAAGAPLALRALALHAEWTRHDRAAALRYTQAALARALSERLRADFEHRETRLLRRGDHGTVTVPVPLEASMVQLPAAVVSARVPSSASAKTAPAALAVTSPYATDP
jgi:uncharacterized protein YprB with RNaseH-like and TPR domain